MQEQNFFQYLKRIYKQYGMIGKLILINLIVFLFFGILYLVQEGFLVDGIYEKIGLLFAGPGNPEELLYQPWSLVTQLFTHFSFFHFLFNMLVLFFSARIFIQLLGERRLLTTYLLGGIFAYLVHVAIYYLVPAFQEEVSHPIVGASGSIMAIFMAIAVMRPNLSIFLFGIVRMPIIILALLYVVSDMIGVGSGDGVAHFAHLGGALFGALSVINVNSPKNFMNRLERWLSKFKLSGLFKRKPKMKVYTQEEVQEMDDDAYREAKAEKQEQIDAILDKISKKGYESLTKREKEILFNESKRK